MGIHGKGNVQNGEHNTEGTGESLDLKATVENGKENPMEIVMGPTLTTGNLALMKAHSSETHIHSNPKMGKPITKASIDPLEASKEKHATPTSLA